MNKANTHTQTHKSFIFWGCQQPLVNSMVVVVNSVVVVVNRKVVLVNSVVMVVHSVVVKAAAATDPCATGFHPATSAVNLFTRFLGCVSVLQLTANSCTFQPPSLSLC